uniref:Carboxylic ester hydrolase n=1 Tax=Diabrotica virgifera virgifera TaxID=50390 RepID=A0A6P7FR02_DIAVI
MYRLIIWFLCFGMEIYGAENDDTIIDIVNGKIRGQVRKSFTGKDFIAYEGIPYAAPPTGQRRFKLPKEPNNWTGILDTTDNTQICSQVFQTNPIAIVGTEDCLYLNVYTPKNYKQFNQTLSVFVYIHGGAFQYRSKSIWLPDYFIMNDIILVTINYRLGVLGFLSTEDGVIPGNLGLKDQRFALRWVSKNVDKFGGSPDKVTLGGQSAGAASVSYQLLDPKNEGLFRGVIMMSGSALCHHELQITPQKVAYRVGQVINSSFTGKSEELLSILQETPLEHLLLTANLLEIKSQFLNAENPVKIGSIENIWLPVVERDCDQDILIGSPMHQAFIDGSFIKVPMVAGFTTAEIVFYPDYINVLTDASKIDANPDFLIDDKLRIANKLEAGRKLKYSYTKSFKQDPDSLIQYLSDNFYTTPILRQAELAMKHVPVYIYQFSDAYNSRFEIQGEKVTAHTSDLPLIFYNAQNVTYPEGYLTQRRFLKLYTNFIKYQDPTPEHDDILIIWPKTTENLDYLNINTTLEVLKHPKNFESWKRILNTYMSKPYVVY